MSFFLVKRLITKNNLKSEKIFSNQHKFIYISVPKAATRSIINALYEEPEFELGSIKSSDQLVKVFSDKKYINYYKFCFIRNPWSRVVSCYLDKIKNTKNHDQKSIVDMYRGIKRGLNFSNFVEFLISKEGSDKYADRHWLSQHKFITDKNGELLVDFMGKVENLENDWRQVCQKIGLPEVNLPVLNTRQGWKPEETKFIKDQYYYQEFYNKDTKEKIGERYKKDIELFDYKF